MLRSFDLFGKTKLLGGGRVTVDSGIQKDVEASCSQDSFWCNSKNIATMDVAILRSEQYLKKFDDMPSFSLGLTPPLGEESNWENVVNISSQYQDVRAEFTQACSPSSHHQEDEQMEVCEEGAVLEERGGGVEVVAEEDVVVEERADGVEMVVDKESSLDERVGGVDIAGEKDVLVDVSVDAVGKGCEKDSLVDKSSVAVAAGEERGVVLLGEGSMMDKGKGIIVDDSGKEAEIQMVEKQEVERRSRKIIVPLRSPYLVRQINVNQFLTATEKGHAYVTASVLDVWSIILNDLERFKDPNSPTRFFATTYPCSYTVVDPQVDDAGRLKRFKENLHIEFQRVPHIKLSALDLLFFRMIASEHSYVICFNIKSHRIDIIDNSSKSITNDQKYGSVPSNLSAGGETQMAKGETSRLCSMTREFPTMADRGGGATSGVGVSGSGRGS
nr:hypothetical protein DM860_018298 [Ipomoea batatas]